MKVLFLVTDDWYFLSHRKGLAVELIRRGHEVHLISNPSSRERWDEIKEAGIQPHEFEFERDLLGQCRNASQAMKLASLYRSIAPDIAHQVGFLPVVYGAFAAKKAKVEKVIHAVCGLGHAYGLKGARGSALRFLIERGYSYALSSQRARVIFQNEEDQRYFDDKGLCREGQSVVIQGAGVDTEAFPFAHLPAGEVQPKVIHASRMLTTKGVLNSIEASKILSEQGVSHQLILAGRLHPENPGAIDAELLEEAAVSRNITWAGDLTDMQKALREASVVLLPSLYREGVPKVLLEAAATGRPMIATDMPGCRDVVIDGHSGATVPCDDSSALAQAIKEVLSNRVMREEWGLNARRLAEEVFSASKIYDETIELYLD